MTKCIRQNMEFDRAVEQTTACQCLNDSANRRSSAMSSVHNTTYKCERRSGPGRINHGIMHVKSASRVIRLQMRNSKLFNGYSTRDSTGTNRVSHFQKYLSNCSFVPKHRLSWSQVQAVFVLVTLCLVCRPGVCSSPAAFNVALNKPVYVTPSNATCGYSASAGQEAFCMSNTDPNYVEICEKSVCNLQCPSERGKLPHYEDVFSDRVSGSTWSGCPYKNFISLAQDGAEGAFSVQFDRRQTACYRNLVNSWMTPLIIEPSGWSATFALWVWPDQGSSVGTILEIADKSAVTVLRLEVNPASRLRVFPDDSGAILSPDSWGLPTRTWTHVAMQLSGTTLSMYLNGSLAGETLYDVKFRKHTFASMYRVGKSFRASEDDIFNGFMQDFRIVMKSVSNREIVELMTGHLPLTRISSNCRCPGTHPMLKQNDITYCVTNPGAGRSSKVHFRLRREAHVLQYVNDGKDATFWLSHPGVSSLSLQLDLLQQYEIVKIEIQFYSPLPGEVRIERRYNSSSEWSEWQRFSQMCPSSSPASTPHTVRCMLLIRPGETIPHSNGLVVMDHLTDRPGHTDGVVYNQDLREFLKAESIRIKLEDQPYVKNPAHKYHGILEINVMARCDCHGHASKCDTSVNPYQCQCDTNTRTEGRTCDQCVQGAYENPKLGPYARDYCQYCDCHSPGTVRGDLSCNKVGGQCNCKANVMGRRCDTCKSGYHKLDATDPEGCQQCVCNATGTTNTSMCDARSGQCRCKTNVMGVTCDTCKSGYYNLQDSNPDGCQPCNCNANGTESGKTECDATTGQCTCKANVQGRACNQCDPGTYNLTNENSAGCELCQCDPDGAQSDSCNQETGQCDCKPNIGGRTCDRCLEGYFAQTKDSFKTSGCGERCGCNVNGTVNATTTVCEPFGGQCPCLINTETRSCGKCKPGTTGFGSSPTLGCTSCHCDIRGSQSGTSCDVTTGKCICKKNVVGSLCSSCAKNSYGLSGTKQDGCSECDCFPGGSKYDEPCDRYSGQCPCMTGIGNASMADRQCPCMTGIGNASMADRQCNSYIVRITPHYGPVSGGTKVEIEGGYMGDVINGSVQVGPIETNTQDYKDSINNTHAVTMTRSLHEENSTHLVNEELPVQLRMPSWHNIVTSASFTYMEDPDIFTVAPMKTFLSGGVRVTVIGSHLDSVFQSFLEVNLEYKKKKQIPQSSSCEVQNGTMMYCPMPPLEMPSDVPLRRRRRDTQSGAVNNDDLMFYMGFKLDGVTKYQDLRFTMGDQGVVKVYRDPEIYRFEEAEHIRLHKPFDPYNEEHIVIRGKHLNSGCSEDDYNIEVGTDICELTKLSSTEILCKPPTKQPSPHQRLDKNGLPAVFVKVGYLESHVGFLQYEQSLWDNPAFRYGLIAGIAAFVLLLLLIIICCLVCRRRADGSTKHLDEQLANKSNSDDYISAYFSVSSQSSYLSPTADMLQVMDVDLRFKVRDVLMESKRMVLGKMIGQGQFGRVHIGRLSDEYYHNPVPVAIKTLREYDVTPSHITQFLEEATIMKDFKHPHVLHLLGVVLDNNRAYVILPYMENGDLKTFIANEENMLTVGELINFSLQIADGMVYLSQQKFVHRDLAARNCMISKELVVKIADFGLSRDIYESDYYKQGDMRRPMPIKWMSIESLEKGVYTTKSDVWSFGVVMWELLTRGCMPYPDVHNFDMKAYLLCGNRMDKPDFATLDLYNLMLSCWEEEPEKRPTFQEIAERITTILEGQNERTMMNRKKKYVMPQKGHAYVDVFG